LVTNSSNVVTDRERYGSGITCLCLLVLRSVEIIVTGFGIFVFYWFGGLGNLFIFISEFKWRNLFISIGSFLTAGLLMALFRKLVSDFNTLLESNFFSVRTKGSHSLTEIALKCFFVSLKYLSVLWIVGVFYLIFYRLIRLFGSDFAIPLWREYGSFGRDVLRVL
jgi:hypothetical protein